MRNISIVFILLILVLLNFSCTKSHKVEEIIKNPEHFLNRELVLNGRVTKVLDIPMVEEDFFKIHDRTGEIWIYTKKGVPPNNIEVKVTGRFRKLLDVPFLDAALKRFDIEEVAYCIELHEIDF